MPKFMSEEICIFFDKATAQSMFKHVASGNGPLVVNAGKLFSNFHCKAHCLEFSRTDWTIKNCKISYVSGLVTKLSNQ